MDVSCFFPILHNPSETSKWIHNIAKPQQQTKNNIETKELTYMREKKNIGCLLISVWLNDIRHKQHPAELLLDIFAHEVSILNINSLSTSYSENIKTSSLKMVMTTTC